MIQIYKKIKFSKEIKYEQKLQQVVMSGVRNVYGPLVIFLGFLGLMVAAFLHLYVSQQNSKAISEDSSVNKFFPPIFWITIILSIMIWMTFMRNSKLR